MDQLISWLQSGYHTVSFFTLVISNCKTTQECASDTVYSHVLQGGSKDSVMLSS